MPHIQTQVVIPAAPDAVWAVMADFERYGDWNPLNLSAHGEAKVGAKVRMVFRNLASARQGDTLQQTVTIAAATPGRELAWTGYVPLLFKGRHGFLLTPQDGGTHVLHTETLSGLVPALWNEARIARDFTPAYAAVNAALAARVAALG